jgi:hypothetical protein
MKATHQRIGRRQRGEGPRRATGRRFGLRGWLPAFLALLVLGTSAARCGAQTGTQHEYEIKTAFLYNIIKYVEWPSSNQPPAIQIGLLGQIQFSEALDVLEGKTIQGRKLVVKRISETEASGCQVVFIGRSEKARLPGLLSGLKEQPILTVSELEGFAEQGGMVNLLAEGNRVSMEINRQVAGQAGLNISSQLLKLAKVVPR